VASLPNASTIASSVKCNVNDDETTVKGKDFFELFQFSFTTISGEASKTFSSLILRILIRRRFTEASWGLLPAALDDMFVQASGS